MKIDWADRLRRHMLRKHGTKLDPKGYVGLPYIMQPNTPEDIDRFIAELESIIEHQQQSEEDRFNSEEY